MDASPESIRTRKRILLFFFFFNGRVLYILSFLYKVDMYVCLCFDIYVLKIKEKNKNVG